MKLVIKVTMDNATFDDYPAGEASRILQEFSRTIRDHAFEPGDSYKLMDYNGNTVGEARVTR